MSKTAPMRYGDLFAWALDDAFAVYCWYLREALGDATDLDADVVSQQRDNLLGSIYAPAEQGLFLTPGTPDAQVVASVLAATRRKVVDGGDLSRAALAKFAIAGETLQPDLNPRHGYGDTISVARTLEVADALEAMFEERLPQRPPYQDWIFGTGRPGDTIGSVLP